MPAAVCVDIGCGMIAVRTQFDRAALDARGDLAALRDAMVGIEFRDTDAFLDEIPQAYKPIEQVMAAAADLVTIRHTLRQLVNVKGD